MPVIDINPIVTSTSDDVEGIKRAFEAIGLEAEPVEQTETQTEPPQEGSEEQPPAEGETAPVQEAGEATTEEEVDEEDDEEQHEPQAQEPQQPSKNKKRRDRKFQRLQADLLKAQQDKAKLEGRIEELSRTRQTPPAAAPQTQPSGQPAESQPSDKPPERPKYPRLADFQFDREAYDTAVEKYWAEDMPAYETAQRSWERKENLKELTGILSQELDTRDQKIVQTQAQREIAQRSQKSLEAALERHPDLQELIDEPDSQLVIPAAIANEAMKSDYQWDIYHYIAIHPDEAAEIYQDCNLPENPSEADHKVAQRLAERYVKLIEAQIAEELGVQPPKRPAARTQPARTNPPQNQPPNPETTSRQTSNAPPPPPRLRGGGSPDSNGRKDPSKMTAVEFNAYLETPEGKHWARTMNT